MDITSFLTREEPVAGLEINDTYIRFCFFTKNKNDGGLRLSIQKEQPLPVGAIVNGIIKNKPVVTKTLIALFDHLPEKIRYVIVTIPAQCTYMKLFNFPKAIQGGKLEETMDLTIGFQLPVRMEDVYLDWDGTGDSSVNEVTLAAANKEIIDDYTAALAAAKLNPVAIEPHICAVLRVIDVPGEAHTLIIDGTTTEDILFWIAHKGTVRFMRSLPRQFASQKEDEIRKISAWYGAEYGVTPTVMSMDHASIHTDIVLDPNMHTETGWFAGIGAALRGAIPRAQDSLISLMPMGTVEAYRRQRAVSFAEFLADASVAVSLFFCVAFIGTWLLMSSLQQRALVQIENLSSIPIDPDTGTLEAHAKTLNELTGAAHQSLQKISRWSTVMDEIRKRSTQGIIITNATFPSPEDVLTIAGTAGNREQLTAFKRTMEESDLFTGVLLPATNLELRATIPFSLSFKIKDPAALYEK